MSYMGNCNFLDWIFLSWNLLNQNNSFPFPLIMTQRPPYFSVALVSAGSLAYEILLMRLFSIIQWHHFAYMIISLALLGYGISGTIVAIAREWILPRYRTVYICCLLLFGLTSVACFLAAQAIPFNAEEILWDGWQSFYLISLFLILAIPFFFVSTAICISLMHFDEFVPRIYAMDLIGAGAGSLGIVILLFFAFPQSALIIVGITGIAAVGVASWELKFARQLWLGIGTVFLIAVLLVSVSLIELNISTYKSLNQTLRINGTRVIKELSSPLGLLSVVESDVIPFRHAPGLSLNATHEPLPQVGVFTDGDNMAVITKQPKKREQLTYLDQMSSALPYHLKTAKRVLIIGAGGGTDILQAQFHDARKIDAVELNPQFIELVSDTYNKFTGELYHQDNVSVHIGEARDYLTRSQQHYDLIQLTLMDAFNASASGLYALSESYLYTTEALELYLKHLEPDGYLAITRWIKMPPRDTLKLFATAVDAIKQSGIESPEKRLALIRSWQTSTLIIKNGVFQAQEITAIQSFCDARSFDLAYTPSIIKDHLNRYNRLNQPVFYLGAISLLGDQRENFLNQYKFNLQPATDDQPYFHHFFKWSALPEIISLRSKGGMSLLESGYMIFIATLLIATLTSLALIILPLYFFRRSQEKITKNNIQRTDVVFYFFSIGLAFLFIEIAFMQKFILLLHHPIYAISVTLTAFLVFAGLGSNWATQFSKNRTRQRLIKFTVSGIVILCLLYLITLKILFTMLVAAPVGGKIFVTILLIAPLAFLMGIPFPLALSNLADYAEQFIPWAWGINGCASVISAVLATLLAIHFGFTVVIILAMLLYILIILVFPAPIVISNHRD